MAGTGRPGTMRAVALARFGGADEMAVRTVPVPEVGPGEVLVRVAVAGVGEWDPFEREGGYAEMFGAEASFPYVLGSEGAGTVAAVGADVDRFRVGDAVYASAFLNPKGGFYAEYVVVDAGLVLPLPAGLSVERAAVVSGVGLTALRGLEDTLQLQPGETLLVFGAGGGIGHVAVQLAKRMGARVIAIASGADGVALARHVGADAAVDGRGRDVEAALRDFAPDGIDAALLTAGGEAAEAALRGMRAGGRVAYPNGIDPVPAAPDGARMDAYNGDPDPDILARLHAMLTDGPFVVHVARTFPITAAADAHRALDEHYLGKLALTVQFPGE